jgi:hypothetical protein
MGEINMRTMHLPRILPIAVQSRDECIELYSKRLSAEHAGPPAASVLLTAYMAWPKDEERRNSFVATHLVRFRGASEQQTSDASPESQTNTLFEMFGGISAVAKPAFDRLIDEISQLQRKWLWVADIFQFTVDMAFEQRITLRRGSSISKAIELCEIEHGLPGHSQLRAAWSEFRDVAHLLTASAQLAHEGFAHGSSVDEASILNAIWIAPDIALALAYGLQEFGLQPKPIRKEPSILRTDTLWCVPDRLKPERPFVIHRSLTETQLAFLKSRRVAKKVA